MGELFVFSDFYDSFKNMENGEFSKLKKAYAKGTELRGKNLALLDLEELDKMASAH